jgi:hypothetical protein
VTCLRLASRKMGEEMLARDRRAFNDDGFGAGGTGSFPGWPSR